MSDGHDPERLRALEDRLKAAKAAQAPKPRSDEHFSNANIAWRMVIELVAGLMIGFGIGYGLDSLFGTLPIFLVLFIGFGLAAGVRTMMRTARELQATQVAQQDTAEHSAEDERD